MIITHQSLPLFEVQLPPHPTPAEWFAADELRRHLLAMLGLPPVSRWEHAWPVGQRPVTLCINCRERELAAGLNAARLAPTPESFYLAPAGDSYFIIGGGTRGTLYAVYELLDRLGCRWFTPQVTHIPRHRELSLPDVPVSGAPAFEFRDLLSWDCADPLWALRNRLNGHFQTIPAHLGGNIVFGRLAHSLFELVPPATYFATHPEYYSEIDGVRRHVAAQLCLTNPEVLRIATESVLRLMRELPNATLISVSQQDWEGWCQCPECRRALAETGAQSGLYLRFINAIAERTVQEFPDKLVGTLAYHYTEAPPTLRIPLHPNVRVQMCPIATCQTHPFESCGGPADTRFLERIRGWTALTDQLYIWHYATDFSHYYLPLPNLRQLFENIRFYKRHDVRGVFTQANGCSELSDLKGYLVARLLWNPATTLETVLDEFLPAVYGAGAAEVRRYIDFTQAAADQDTTHHLGCYEPPDHPFYTDAFMEGAVSRLTRAEKLARGAARERVRLLRTGVDLAQLYRHYSRREFRREGRIFHCAAAPADARRFRAAIQTRRAAGGLPLSESTHLEVEAERIGRWFERHALVELSAGTQRLFVAPSLGGRILEWHVGDRQLLQPPDPANRHLPYPMSEGCADLVISPPYSFTGCRERFAVSARTRRSVTLTATVEALFRLERVITLTPDGLQLRSTLTNISDRPQARQWGCGLHLQLADWTRLSLDTAAGVRELIREPATTAAPAAALVLARETRPTGTWRLSCGALTLTTSFTAAPVTTLIVEREDARQRLALDLRTDVLTLAPQQTLVIEQRCDLVVARPETQGEGLNRRANQRPR